MGQRMRKSSIPVQFVVDEVLIHQDKIRILRIEKGISQEKLVELMGMHGVPMHRTTLTKIEKGVRCISLLEAKALARIFNTTMDEMFDSGRKEELLKNISAGLRAVDYHRTRIDQISSEIDRWREEYDSMDR